MTEVWKQIPGFDGYEASSHGRIRSMDRVIWFNPSTRCKNGYKRWMRGRILKPAPLSHGHLAVVPGRERGTQQVHQLVALAFHGPCPPGMEVLHLDECATNNRPCNLKYGTRSDNLKSAWAAGKRTVHPNFIGARWR